MGIVENGEKLCDDCHKEIATVHLENIGDFCPDCYNRRMMEKRGLSDERVYLKEYTAVDKVGKSHTFRLSHYFHGDIITWEAEEENGGYELRAYSRPEDPSDLAEKAFLRAIDKMVTKTTISKDGNLKEKGNLDIVWDRNEVKLKIDGKLYTADEFFKLLETYEGWHIKYKIKDGNFLRIDKAD